MLKEIIIAFQSYAEAHQFIVKNKLWKWILIPGIIYMLLFISGLYFFWKFSNEAVQFIFTSTGLMAWLNSMKESWLNLLVIVGQIIIVSVLLSFFFSVFKLLFLVFGSPVFAYLSEKTESILKNVTYPFSITQLGKDSLRGIQIAFRNFLWQTVYLLAIFLLSFIPLIGWIAPLAALLVECYYFGFSMLDYNSERNKLSVPESIGLISNHKGLAIGNGIVFYLLHLVPVIGWLFAPSYAVVAATLSIFKARQKQVII